MLVKVAVLLCFVAVASAVEGDWSPESRKYNLRYFNIRGLAEPVRLFLEDMQLPYTENSFSSAEWKEAKPKLIADGVLAFGQLPLLQTPEGYNIVQSKTIMRHLARTHDKAGKSESDLIRCDMLAEGVEDIRGKLRSLVYGPAAEYTIAKKEEYAKEIYAPRLVMFEKHLNANGGNGYFIGDDLTYMDILLWDVMNTHVEYLGSLPTEVPNLVKWYNRVAARPGLAAYLSSPRRHAYSAYPMPEPKA